MSEKIYVEMSAVVPCKRCGRWPHYELTYRGKYRLRCVGCPHKTSSFVSYDEAVADWEAQNRVSPDDFLPVPSAPLEEIQALVDQQSKDEGLWFQAETASEAYLQQELRRLHALIEGDSPT